MNRALEEERPLESSNSPLDDALLEARQAYIDNNPASILAHQQAREVMPGGNTRTVLFNDPFPLRIVSGKNATLTDADDHQYLNLLGEYTAGLFGHSHPVIRAAIDQALDRGVNLSGHNPDEIRLARQITQRFASIDKVRFTNSGTEANLMAIAAARYFTGRSKVMVMNGAYHGGLLYFVNGGIPTNAPYPFVLGKYNDEAETAQVLQQHGDDLACILVEPMMGSGGCLPADAGFLQMLREQSRRIGAVLIFDEVMTSRISGGGAQQYLGITPDMTTLGKYIGGGMSFGAFGGREDIMAMYNPETQPGIPHAGTFNNNSLTMAAGAAAMETVFTPEVAEALNQRGEAFRQKLNEIALNASVPVHFTGIGSLMNMHGCEQPIRCPEDRHLSDDRIKQLIFLDLLQHGFYIARRGFIALMLSVTDEDLDNFCNCFAQILQNRQSVLRS